jgi:hypothetical protein
MPLPFLYPQEIHKRTQHPPRASHYRSYKVVLREEFARRCVYCCRPDGFGSLDEFVVEHYAPQHLFADRLLDYNNLFYACQPCNRRKGAYWPDDAQRAAGSVIVNPCDYRMTSHVRFSGDTVIARSSEGRWTLGTLDLNGADCLSLRVKVRGTIDALNANIEQLRHAIADCTIELAATADPDRTRSLTATRDKYENRLTRVRQLRLEYGAASGKRKR